MIKTKNLFLIIIMGGTLISSAFADSPTDNFDVNSFLTQQANTILAEQAGFDLIANNSIEKLEACLKKHFDGNDCEVASSDHDSYQSKNPTSNTDTFADSTPAASPIQNTTPPESTPNKSSGSNQLPIASSNSNSSGWHYKL